MNLLIDTNIIIDYLADRPHADQAEQVIEACSSGDVKDFRNSTVKPITPEDFLKKHGLT